MPRAHWDRRQLLPAAGLALLAVGAVVTWPGTAVPPFLPIGAYAAYDANTPSPQVLIEPVIHAPWHGAATPFGSALATLAVMAAFWVSARSLGAGAGATVVAMAAFVSRPDLRVLMAMASGTLLGMAAVWTSAVVAGQAVTAARFTLMTGILCALGVAAWPPVVILVPVLMAWSLAASGAARGIVAGSAGVVGLAAGVVGWAIQAAAIGGVVVSVVDVWQVAVGAGDRGVDPFVWPPLSATLLPVAFMAVGAVAALSKGQHRELVVAGGLVTAALAVLAAAGWPDEALRALYWGAWPLAACGLTWFLGLATGPGRALLLCVLAAVLVGGGVSATVRDVAAVDARSFAAALSALLTETQREGRTTFIAEDTRVDAALVAALGSSLARVPRVPSQVTARAGAGHTVLAAGASRPGLELWGLRFAERFAVESPVRLTYAAYTGRFRCLSVGADWRDLPGLEFTGRLGVHLPAGQGRFEAMVVTMPPAAVAVTTPNGQPRGRLSPVTPTLDSLPGVLWPRGTERPNPKAVATRVEVDAAPSFDSAVSIALGARAPAVAVRFLSQTASPVAATVCAAPFPREDPLEPTADARLALDDPAYFTAGWHAPEGQGVEMFRWSTGRAVIHVPSSTAREVTLAIDARPAASSGRTPVTVRAIVNGWDAGVRRMSGAVQHEWPVPARIWVDGTNEVVFEVSQSVRPADRGGRDTRELGMQVTAIRLRREN